MSFIIKYIIIILFSFFSIGISNTLKAEAIKIPLHQWPSQQVGATIIGMLFGVFAALTKQSFYLVPFYFLFQPHP